MLRYLAITALIILFSCTNDDVPTDTVLDKPPYKTLTDSIRIAPGKSELYYRRGSLLYHNNLLAHAEKDMRTAWSIDKTEEYALSLTTILKEKNADSAIVFLQQAVQQLPGSIALHVGLARGYQQKGQFDKALGVIESILAQYTTQLDALVVKSEILKQQGKSAEALTILEKAYSYAPGDKALAYDLAYEYAEAKNAKALRLTDTLLVHDKTETAARAYYVKAIYFENTGNIPGAIRYHDSAIIKNYTFLDAYVDRGRLLYESKKYDEALKNFERALNVSPSTADFFFWIGKVQEAKGNKAEAKLNYQRAYSLDQTMAEAKEAAERL